MRIFFDTNILVRLMNPVDPNHATAFRVANHYLRNGDDLVLAPQNVYEFWVVATRPAVANGLGMTVTEAATELVNLRQQFTILDDIPPILHEWERLVTTHGVIGKPAYDARLVAAMPVHGLTHILTFNIGDFQRFPGITVLDPAMVAAPGP